MFYYAWYPDIVIQYTFMANLNLLKAFTIVFYIMSREQNRSVTASDR